MIGGVMSCLRFAWNVGLAVLFVLITSNECMADTHISWTNRTGGPLYIYYKTVPNGTTISCQGFIAGGTIAPGQTWSISIAIGQWGWFRFDNDPRGLGCDSRYNKYETRAAGTSPDITQSWIID